MSSTPPDRNLLFGILAVQMDFVTRDALMEGMNAWVLRKSTPLGDILVDQGVLERDDYALLDPMVRRHIELHQNDPQKSLAALSSASSFQHSLKEIADPDVQHSLNLLSRDANLALSEKTTEAPHSDSQHRYRILHRHAEGGLGTVFVAYDEELHRDVALKEIQQQHAMHAASRARFVQEAEITGKLEHPGVVPVYGLGHYEDGRPFYAMRFIKGDSLHDAAKRFHKQVPSSSAEWRRVELRRLLGRFIDVCDAVGYAHNRGVLHRDLKPGNIMIGKYGETLVVDWGLATLMGDTADQQRDETVLKLQSGSGPIQTMLGSVVGTPHYMSPEQAAGQLDQLTEASDIYGLGATLYYILTCQPPVTGTTTQETLEQAQLGKVAAPRDVNPNVPRPLEAICMKAVARQPARRYASCRELANDVEAYLADTPVSAYRGVLYRSRLWLLRHRTAVVVACVLLACLAAFTGYVTMRHWKVAEQIQGHSDRAAWAVESSDLGKGVAELTAAQALTTSGSTTADRIARWAKQLRDYRVFETQYDEIRLAVNGPSNTSADDRVATSVRAALGTLSALDNPNWPDQFNNSLLSEQQLASLQTHVGELTVQLAMRIAREWNDDDESRVRTREALALLDHASTFIEFGIGIHSLRARWQRRLGESHKVDSSWNQALDLAKEGTAGKRNVFDQYVFAQVAETMLLRDGSPPTNGEKVLRLYESVLRHDPQFFRAHFGMYHVYQKLGDTAGQLRHLEACLALSPHDPFLYYFRGMVYFAQGSADPSYFLKARGDFDTSVARDPRFATGYYYSGRMNVALRNWREAVPRFDRAIQCDPTMNGPYYWRAIGRAKIGMYRQAAADADEAVRRDPNDKLVLYYAARAYAQSVPAIEQADLADDERQQMINTYANTCRQLLARAFEAGFDEVGRCVPGSDFDPVYGVADIRELVKEQCQKLLDRPPTTAETQSTKRAPVPKGELLLTLGDLAKSAEQWDVALDWYTKSQTAYVAAITQKQRLPSSIADMRRAMSGRVEVLDRLEQFDRAEAAFRLLLRLHSRVEPELRIERALNLLSAGHHERAVDMVRPLVLEKLRSRLDIYDLACVYARASDAVAEDSVVTGEEPNKLSSQYSDQAIKCLRKAHAEHFFRSPATLEHLKTDPDLDPLRGLPAFQTLMREIETKSTPTDKRP